MRLLPRIVAWDVNPGSLGLSSASRLTSTPLPIVPSHNRAKYRLAWDCPGHTVGNPGMW